MLFFFKKRKHYYSHTSYVPGNTRGIVEATVSTHTHAHIIKPYEGPPTGAGVRI